MPYDWLPEEADERTEISYPLNNRWYTAKYPQAFNSTRASGVFSSDEDLILRPVGGLRVNLSAGIAWIRADRFKGVMYAQTDNDGITFDVPPPHGHLTRRDRVAIRFDYLLNDIFSTYKVGIAGQEPPKLQRDSEAFELHLHEIVVSPGTLQINQSMITDLRHDEEFCGIMRDSVTRIPTQQLYDTFQSWNNELRNEMVAFFSSFRGQTQQEYDRFISDAMSNLYKFDTKLEAWRIDRLEAFEKWFDSVTFILDGDIAANLTNRITQHELKNVADTPDGVHGMRFIDGTLQVLTAAGWVIVGGASSVIGYTAGFFDA